MAFPTILAVVCLSYIIVFVGIYVNNMIKILGAMLLTITGIVLIASGLEGLDNLVTLAFGAINIAIGSWLMVEDLFSDNLWKKGGNE